jgi:hypothetical protein
MSKLMYEGECENYYTKRDMKINVCWGMWKLMYERECEH